MSSNISTTNTSLQSGNFLLLYQSNRRKQGLKIQFESRKRLKEYEIVSVSHGIDSSSNYLTSNVSLKKDMINDQNDGEAIWESLNHEMSILVCLNL